MPENKKEQVLSVRDLDITFKTTAGPVHAIRGVNIDLYKGETVALVGESGSGKTTIGRAIMRILPTSGGEILYKGQKINGKISKELDREVIRKIQMIFQDPMASLNERAKVEYIIAEGLLNHHLYKDQEDLHEKVMNALHEVGLLPEFASRFPHEFSGGQRQRLSIARAVLKNPEILILDEATSALDTESEKLVQDALNSLLQGRTSIVIAHRLSTIKNADLICVFHEGEIVERGTHEELLSLNGIYTKLYSMQSF